MSLPPLKQIVTADTSQLEGAMNKGKLSIAGFAKAGAAAFAAVGAALVAMTRRAMVAIDEQAKLARAVGGTTRGLQALTRAGDRAGVAQSELASAATRLNQRLGEVIATGKGADATFQALGLSARELADMDIDQRFMAISDAMRRAGMSSQEMSYHLRELGIRQSSVISLIQQGSEEIERSGEMIDRLGVAVSDVDARKIEAANDAMQELGRAFEGVGNILAVRFAPLIERASQRLTRLAEVFIRLLKPNAEAAAEAQRVLNERLGIFVNEAAPNAAQEALNAAASNYELAESAYEAAKAHRELFLARMASGFAMPGQVLNEEDRESIVAGAKDAFGDFMAELDENIASSRAKLDEALASLTRARVAALQAPPGVILGAAETEPEPTAGVSGAGKLRDQMAERLEALRDALATEREVVAAWYEEGRQTLENALAAEKIDIETYHEMRERLEEEHQRRLNAIREAGGNTGLEVTKGVLGSMLQAVQAGGERLIKAQKAISLALAAINVYEGITKALTLPWPQNFAVAAQTAAQGFAAIARLQSVSKGNTGGGMGTEASRPVPTQNITIDLVGDTFSRNSVQSLFEEINRGLRSGYQIEGVLVR